MSEYSPPPQPMDERIVRITKRIEIQDACVGQWRIVDEENLTALEQLALAQSDLNLDQAMFRCAQHGEFFTVAGRCPRHATTVEPGDLIAVPYHVGGALIARREAENVSCKPLPPWPTQGDAWNDDRMNTMKQYLKDFSEIASLGGSDEYFENVWEL